MPRTKLDVLSLPAAEARARIVRVAAARMGLNRDKDIAEFIHVSAGGICSKLKGGRPWSVDELLTLTKKLYLSDTEIAQFVRGRYE